MSICFCCVLQWLWRLKAKQNQDNSCVASFKHKGCSKCLTEVLEMHLVLKNMKANTTVKSKRQRNRTAGNKSVQTRELNAQFSEKYNRKSCFNLTAKWAATHPKDFYRSPIILTLMIAFNTTYSICIWIYFIFFPLSSHTVRINVS